MSVHIDGRALVVVGESGGGKETVRIVDPGKRSSGDLHGGGLESAPGDPRSPAEGGRVAVFVLVRADLVGDPPGDDLVETELDPRRLAGHIPHFGAGKHLSV